MIITSKFVLINLPKTGSTFARDMIKTLHKKDFNRWNVLRYLNPDRAFELKLPINRIDNRNAVRKYKKDYHGTCHQIPKKYSHLPIVTIVRNPYERLLSVYNFGSWKHNLPVSREELKNRYPTFPDLGFTDFLDFYFGLQVLDFLPEGVNNFRHGPQTAQFVTFFARDKKATFAKLNEGYNISDLYKDYFFNVQFLHTENLNNELYSFVLQNGYKKPEIDFILISEKRNVRQNKIVMTEVERNLILEKEAPLFELFKEYNEKNPMVDFVFET